MTSKNKTLFDDVVKHMNNIRNREEAELKKLCEAPDIHSIAQLLTDKLILNLQYLCNFDHVVDHHGNKHPAVDVLHCLEDYIKDEFKKLTGKDYVATICRNIDYRKENPS